MTFSYDPAGNLISYDDGLTSGSYSYNALNQKLSETVTYPNFSKSFSYDYTANGLKKSFTMPDGTAYEYTYGENNELREIRLPGTGSISYPSYTWTRPDAVQYPGGGRREYEYDPLMRLTRITAKDPGKNILLDYSYTYDTMDNILSKQTGQGTYNYTYDALSRLTDVQVDIPGRENEGFSYDAVGNRLTEEGVEGEWAYNDNNELLTFATTEYTYDANGNATQLLLDGAVMFTYHYSAQDRLVQVDDVNGDTLAEYSYNPFGRRLWKDVGGIRTYFFYSDEGLVAEYDTSGTEIRSYGYRPNSMWTTDLLWLKQGGEYHFYQNDHLGTPQKLVKQNGAIVWSASYTAFGQARIEVETVGNNLRFPGQYFDAETGLHYNYFRYYSPGIGRYLRTDPIGFAGGDVHLYGYALNNPLNSADPAGLVSFQDLLNFNHGDNPLNRVFQPLKHDPLALFRPPKLPIRRPMYGGGEVHVIGGIGYILVTCCDISKRARVFSFFKVCVGLTLGVSISGGIVQGIDGKDCHPTRYKGWFLELGLGAGVLSGGVDIGLRDKPTPNVVAVAYPPDPDKFSGVYDVGGGFGTGALMKGSLCRYYFIGEIETSRCECR